MSQRFPARTLDAARYAQTFAEFISRSHEYPAMLDRLVETAGRCAEGFACLDVGAGTGKVIRDWLAHDGRRPGRYVAIEPNAAHAAQLREAVAELNLAADVLEAEYPGCEVSSPAFDLVLFSHSLYWMPDPVAAVRQAYESLASGGVVLAFLQGPFGGHTLYHLFNPLLDRDRPPGPDHGFSSHELVQRLRATGFAPRVEFDPTTIELTGMFDEGAEQHRDEFISFYLQVEFSQLAEPLKSDIVNYLRAACVAINGQLHLHQPTAAVQLIRDNETGN